MPCIEIPDGVVALLEILAIVAAFAIAAHGLRAADDNCET